MQNAANGLSSSERPSIIAPPPDSTIPSTSQVALNNKRKKKQPATGLMPFTMSESTIYKRHQARVVKNMEKPEDPRPAAVRVLSGLPGFRVFVPPYDPSSMKNQLLAAAGVHNESFSRDIPPSNSYHPLHVLVAAGMVGATAEAFYGRTKALRLPHESPFGILRDSREALHIVKEQGTLSLQALQESRVVEGVARSQLKAGAATASVLFGSKAFLSSYMDDDTSPLASVASSAVAGALVAAVNVVQSTSSVTEARFLRMPMPLAQKYTLPRHVMGATLYFGTFEALNGYLSSKSNPKEQSTASSHSSIITVALSGATAGALYQSVLLAGNPSCHKVRWAPTLLRVAPAHALLFVAYQWTQGTL